MPFGSCRKQTRVSNAALLCSGSPPRASVTESKGTSPELCIALVGAPAEWPQATYPNQVRAGGRRQERRVGQHSRTKPPSGDRAYVVKSVSLAGGCNLAWPWGYTPCHIPSHKTTSVGLNRNCRGVLLSQPRQLEVQGGLDLQDSREDTPGKSRRLLHSRYSYNNSEARWIKGIKYGEEGAVGGLFLLLFPQLVWKARYHHSIFSSLSSSKPVIKKPCGFGISKDVLGAALWFGTGGHIGKDLK